MLVASNTARVFRFWLSLIGNLEKTLDTVVVYFDLIMETSISEVFWSFVIEIFLGLNRLSGENCQDGIILDRLVIPLHGISAESWQLLTVDYFYILLNFFPQVIWRTDDRFITLVNFLTYFIFFHIIISLIFTSTGLFIPQQKIIIQIYQLLCHGKNLHLQKSVLLVEVLCQKGMIPCTWTWALEFFQ